ncbi:hypothetical protein P5V15_001551 [Pogonomyrmex californicus]
MADQRQTPARYDPEFEVLWERLANTAEKSGHCYQPALTTIKPAAKPTVRSVTTIRHPIRVVPAVGTRVQRSTASNERKLQGLLQTPPPPPPRGGKRYTASPASRCAAKLAELFGSLSDLSDDEEVWPPARPITKTITDDSNNPAVSTATVATRDHRPNRNPAVSTVTVATRDHRAHQNPAVSTTTVATRDHRSSKRPTVTTATVAARDHRLVLASTSTAEQPCAITAATESGGAPHVPAEAASPLTDRPTMPAFGPEGPPPIEVIVADGLCIRVPYFAVHISRLYKARVGARKFVLRFNRQGECHYKREM